MPNNKHLFGIFFFALFFTACGDTGTSTNPKIQNIPIELENNQTLVSVSQNNAMQQWIKLETTPSKFVAQHQAQGFVSIQNPEYGKAVPDELLSNIYTSNDGVVWTANNTPLKGEFNTLKHIQGWYYAVGHGYEGYSDPLIQRSQDGVNWEVVYNENTIKSKITHIHFADGLYVATGTDGYLFTSPDGQHWDATQSASQLSFDASGSLNNQHLLIDLSPLSLYQVNHANNLTELAKINIEIIPNPADYQPKNLPITDSISPENMHANAKTTGLEPIGFHPVGFVENNTASILQIMNRLYFLNQEGEWSVAEFPTGLVKKFNTENTLFKQENSNDFWLVTNTTQVLTSMDGKNWKPVANISNQKTPPNGVTCVTNQCHLINGTIYLQLS